MKNISLTDRKYDIQLTSYTLPPDFLKNNQDAINMVLNENKENYHRYKLTSRQLTIWGVPYDKRKQILMPILEALESYDKTGLIIQNVFRNPHIRKG